MSTYFLHYRNFDFDLKPANKGGMTIAIRPLDDNKAIIGIARCSNKDMFNKKLGRTIATNRIDAFERKNRDMGENVMVIDIPTGAKIKDAAARAVEEAFFEEESLFLD